VLAPFGAGAALHGLATAVQSGTPWSVPLRAVLSALLVPLAAYALEMTALRRLEEAVFGTLMALEPMIGMLAGWALLAQVPAPAQLPGVVLVVAAGVGAARPRRGSGPPATPLGSV
jgi:inner membrane transporter RhtA